MNININQNKRNLGGLILIVSAFTYFIAEFITAAAFPIPYSYTRNFISNLGVKGPSTLFGQFMQSPLSWLMNSGFILLGLLTFLGIVLLPIKGKILRLLIPLLAAEFMVGTVLVGVFPGSGEALQNGTGEYHSIGAFLAFFSGNVALILLGLRGTGLLTKLKSRRTLIALGFLGLVCMVLYVVVLMNSVDDKPVRIIGLIERGALYPALFGFIYLGKQLRKKL